MNFGSLLVRKFWGISVLTFSISLFIIFGVANAIQTKVQAAVTNIYVSDSSGNDSTNNGTLGSPYKTILKASQVATPGTIVHVAPGTYTGGFQTTASGTATDRISYVSDTKWGAKIVPPALESPVTEFIWDNRGNYVDIDGFEVDGRLDKNGISTKALMGLYNSSSYTVIKNNYVHHVATTNDACTNHGGAGINTDYWVYGVNSSIIGNVVHDIGPPGCSFIYGIYISTSGIVKNNLVYNNGGAGIHLWHDANHIDIANNTVFSSESGIIVGGGDYYHTTGPADYVNVSNNIVIDTTYGISERGDVGPHNTYTNNLTYRNSTYNWSLNPTQGNTHTGTIIADPQFVNYISTGGGDYHLGSRSPAIDAGASTYAPATDLDGIPRPYGAGYDIGAYECTNPAVTHIYVSDSSGNDSSNNGTLGSPYKTILKASQVAIPGTIVHVAPGTYTGGFQTTVSGTATDRIRYVSDTKWGAKIVPPALQTPVTRFIWDNRGNYVDIEGFEVDGRLDKNGISTKALRGLYNAGSYSVIKNNYVHHIATTSDVCTNGGSGIISDAYYFGVNHSIIGNVIHDIGSTGCNYINGIYFLTSGTVKNNLVYNISGAAIQLWHDANHVDIANNTVFSSESGIMVGGGDYFHTTGPADYVNVSNNIVIDTNRGISEVGDVGSHNTYTNNLTYSNSTYNWNLNPTIGNTHTGTITADPQFVNYISTGGGDYHLTSTSPAIDAGASTHAPSTDLDGSPRPSGAGFDIGAYEYKSIANLALGKTFTGNSIGTEWFITDGISNNTSQWGSVSTGDRSIKVDLGASYDLTSVKIWHYTDGRMYHDVIVQMSNDVNFASGVTTVFNNDVDGSAGQGIGTDAEYPETIGGKTFTFSPINTRYVRLWTNGSTGNDYGHYMEVEIWGK
ncbi:DUF1565 domain-containing protein [Paenibacillus sp. LjRoot153]|uniref:choice-of-anchor Q domain-containing protein n=1 Tax=Paenibacillus sp. LjRoot153 TaxID=3342270 RepID=UPI003ECC506D